MRWKHRSKSQSTCNWNKTQKQYRFHLPLGGRDLFLAAFCSPENALHGQGRQSFGVQAGVSCQSLNPALTRCRTPLCARGPVRDTGTYHVGADSCTQRPSACMAHTTDICVPRPGGWEAETRGGQGQLPQPLPWACGCHPLRVPTFRPSVRVRVLIYSSHEDTVMGLGPPCDLILPL